MENVPFSACIAACSRSGRWPVAEANKSWYGDGIPQVLANVDIDHDDEVMIYEV